MKNSNEFTEAVKMYIEWQLGYDDTLKFRDVFDLCETYSLDFEDVCHTAQAEMLRRYW